MITKSLRGVSCCLFLVSAFATVPAFASDNAGAGMGTTPIVSGTEDFVGPGGAAVSRGAMGTTRIVSGTEDFVGPGGAEVSRGAMGTTRIVSGTEDFVGPGGAAVSRDAMGTTLSHLEGGSHATPTHAS